MYCNGESCMCFILIMEPYRAKWFKAPKRYKQCVKCTVKFIKGFSAQYGDTNYYLTELLVLTKYVAIATLKL